MTIFAHMRQSSIYRMHFVEVLIHIIGWGMVFTFPYFMMTRSGFNLSWSDYLHHGGINSLAYLLMFYLNYCVLIPKFLFHNRLRSFILTNIVLMFVMAWGIHYFHQFFLGDNVSPQMHNRPPVWAFITHDAIMLLLVTSLSVAIKLIGRWAQIESVRKEAEQMQTEAELTNLRSQLNPHFLLNTLNNIYALITFDPNRAQDAVQELSRLLRHVLYDYKEHFTTLNKETEFIRNYIELMRIRLADDVQVKTDIDINPESRTPIAPLLFISLIENAFKHGISPTQPSYIRISFSEDAGVVRCDIRNSYHPKSEADKSGSGIGLEQVQKRLSLIYPGRHHWQHGVSNDGKEYYSTLSIDTTESKDV